MAPAVEEILLLANALLNGGALVLFGKTVRHVSRLIVLAREIVALVERVEDRHG